MATIQRHINGNGTGSSQTTTIYAVPSGRNFYLRYAMVRTNGALAVDDFMDLVDSTNGYHFLSLFASTTSAPAFLQQSFGKRGLCFGGGDNVQLVDLIPNAQGWTAYIEGDLI